MKSEFARFLVVGAIAAAANIGSRILFNQWTSFVPAMIMAFVVGLTTAFLLNREWVFLRSGKRWPVEAAWFLAINFIGLAQTIAMAWILARHILPGLGQTVLVPETAHTIGVIVPIATSYLGHKYLTFRKHD